MIFDRMKLVKDEANRVTWPSYREALVSSAIVMSLMAVSGIALWIIDLCLGSIGSFLLRF
jgi:preprotein translocase SecE subunit